MALPVVIMVELSKQEYDVLRSEAEVEGMTVAHYLRYKAGVDFDDEDRDG